MSSLLSAIRGTVSQTRAAALANGHLPAERAINQSKVSRAEDGRSPLGPDQVTALAIGLGATAQQRRRLVELAQTFAASEVTDRPTLIRRPHLIQDRIKKLEEASALIRAWQPEVVFGMLQTPAWTEAAFGQLNDRWWEARRARLDLLDDISRTWHFVMSEAVLRWNLGTEVMAAQLDYLVESITRSNVQLGIVPLATVKPFPAPVAFHVYGRRAVQVATPSGSVVVETAAEIADYEATFKQVDAAALYDDQARDLITSIRSDYR